MFVQCILFEHHCIFFMGKFLLFERMQRCLSIRKEIIKNKLFSLTISTRLIDVFENKHLFFLKKINENYQKKRQGRSLDV